MGSVFFSRALVLVRGGGDLASGAIARLVRAGFPVIVTELPAPMFVRRAVCFGEAVYSGQNAVEGIPARLAADALEAGEMALSGVVAVLVDPEGAVIRTLRPAVVVDARMAKVNTGTRLDDAPHVVALGPGFTAGLDCHAVVETNRGHDLGRVIYAGSAEPDTGEPGMVEGKTHSRVLRAPVEGHVHALATIGDRLVAGQAIATVAGTALLAPFGGVLRGLIHERVWCAAGMKIGDLDPRAKLEACFTLSDKSLAVGGGVLESVLGSAAVRDRLVSHETAKSV